ncbi:MAG: hypothetical protein EPO64_00595 [Nitrospirae bacterium]|nr:MAG: hypothetical protein EPO64_00595 [Nitrospirota bacterium]
MSMQPLLLNIPNFPQPTEGAPGPQGLLVPGELIQATVLERQDAGKLLILVKGVPLSASSLVGQLQPGQVIQARVEQVGGQILLKLEPPVRTGGYLQPALNGSDKSSQLLEPGGVGEDVRGQAGTVRPPIRGFPHLVELPGALYHGEEGPEPRLPIQQGGNLPTVPAVPMKAGGGIPFLRVEPQPSVAAEQADLLAPAGPSSQEGPQEGPQESPIEAGQPSRVSHQSYQPIRPVPLTGNPVPFPLPSDSSEAIEVGRPVLTSQAAASQHVESKPRPQAGDTDPIAQLLRTLLPVDESFGPSFDRLLNSVRTAVLRKEIPERVGVELERFRERLVLKAAEATGPQIKEALVAKGLQHERALLPFPEKDGDGRQGTRTPSEPTLKGWLMTILKVHAKPVWEGPSVATGSGEAPARTSSQETAQTTTVEWVKEAQHMLHVIEREQVINSLNVQQGQPLLVELPLNLGTNASALLYVYQPDGDGARQQQSKGGRSHSLVTLLELDGIGAIRVDARLTGKRIAARFMVDRSDVERAVAALLPTLSQGLTARGYQVETLSSGVADSGTVHGEDLAVPMAPGRSLVNVRA